MTGLNSWIAPSALRVPSGKISTVLPRSMHLARLAERLAQAALAIERREVREVLEVGAAPAVALEEVVLRRERHDVLRRTAERVLHEPHVEVARVVRGDDGVAVVRDERAAVDLRAHHLVVEAHLRPA